MIKGFNSFKEWFAGYEEHYVVIGGMACDLLFDEVEADFRVTKDVDMVLLVEALNVDFGLRFWEYIKHAEYNNRYRSNGTPEYYRFINPKSSDYPVMIELFSRRLEGISLPTDAVLTPLPVEESISSLSAILLDDDYYNFLNTGVRVVEGIPTLQATHLIPFKAKAWLDLTDRKSRGEMINSRDIKKHKNDIIRLSALLQSGINITLPKTILSDMRLFIQSIDNPKDYQRIVNAYSINEIGGDL